MNDTILCIVAHSDDEVIGAGGTLLKYSKEGKKIIEIIFSYGELSHLKRELIIKTRVKEAKKAAKMMGIKDVIFLGLLDGRIKREIENKNIKSKIIKIIKKYKPIKIFTHLINDPHPDHRAVGRVVIDAAKNFNNYEVYCFEVMNLGGIKLKDYPSLFVDISNFFKSKLDVLKVFSSQRQYTYQLLPIIFTRAKLNGEKIKVKYAERFYKLL